jgi:TnpA family transposase
MKKISCQFSESQREEIKRKPKKTRLYYALQWQYYEENVSFFSDSGSISNKIISRTAKLFGLPKKIDLPSKKTQENYREAIRQYFQFRKPLDEDEVRIRTWLTVEVLPRETPDLDKLKEKVIIFLKDQKIESLGNYALDRLIRSILSQYEANLFNDIATKLTSQTREDLDALFTIENNETRFAFIKRCPSGLSLKTILQEADKLSFLKAMVIPEVIKNLHQKTLAYYYRQITTKYPSAIKTMPEETRYALLAIFAWSRKRQILDNMAELLIRLIKKMMDAGETKLKKELSQVIEIKKSCSTKELLNTLISTILLNEDKVIKEAIYPIFPKAQLEAIKNNEQTISYEYLVHTRAKGSYVHHYRRLLVPILELMEFHTNDPRYESVVEALGIIKEKKDNESTYFPEEYDIPLTAIQKSHHSLVLKKEESEERVSRVDYEICLLRNLRKKLRIKEVWIADSKDYCNPDEDLPQDFETKRNYYYHFLKQPLDAEHFIQALKKKVRKALKGFNENLPKNEHVQLLKRSYGHIKIASLEEQPPPPQLEKIKQMVFKKWPNTNLLDVLKETELFVNFLDDFTASGPKEGLDKEVLRKRLLLVIMGYGTNAGLKNISAGHEGLTYQDLKHVKQRYLETANLREAIRKTINHLLEIRMPEIWRDCTTAVASDSKHFKVVDQNLMSIWHPRYHSKGVMIYWHVEKKSSLCIYSQLKNCLSSEVSAMIEGILRHCTKLEVKKNYVDTHGASEVGFAFSYILNFELLPRFKNIHSQRLYLVDKEDAKRYKNLTPILSKSIKWERVAAQYDQIIRYTAALKLGTANAEILMKRFTKDNVQHPTYKALVELGRAVKTIFLCRYLSSLELRQEINEGLNVVERWNGVNDFIFYGNAGIMRNKNPTELELAMLCLHLLQLSMIFINTLLLQQVIQESKALEWMTLEDKRAITPLLHKHINPYGLFILNLNQRLAINHAMIKKVA